MRRTAVGWVLFLASLAAPSRAERITLATYNVENYVSTDRMVEQVYHRDYPKPEAEKAALRAVIRATRADVIVLEEMGPRPYLTELQRDLNAMGVSYPYADLLEADDRDRHVAVLSNRPIARARHHTDLRFSYFTQPETVKRGLLEVHFRVGDAELIVCGVHLKSRFTDRADDPDSAQRRRSEAMAVRERVRKILSEPQKTFVALVGDFNDVPKSHPVQLLLRRGKSTLFEMLPASDSRGETWTHAYRKEDSYSRIDYVLVSPALRRCVVEPGARIEDIPETLIASDHRPVVVTFEIP